MSIQNPKALLLTRIVAQVEEQVNAFLDHASAHPQASFTDLESQSRQLSRECFALALAAVVESRALGWEEASRCSCGGIAQYKGEQERSQETLVGRVRWRRGYYYCHSCGRGRYPLDQALGIAPGQFSEALQSGAARLGAALPFAPAAESFTALTGTSISARQVERITEGRGATLEAQWGQEREELMQGQESSPRDSSPAEAGGWAATLDAAKVRFGDGWHEVKAGVVFRAEVEPDEERMRVKAHQQSYLAHVGAMEQAGERLYAEAIRRGIDLAQEQVVCVADGAPGNWSQFGQHFPQRVEVLDWYHAVEHLWSAGNGVFGLGSAEAQTWVEERREELWEGQVEAVLKALRGQAQQPGGRAAEDEIHYFETNQERMRYQEFRSKGYPIGSGTVESACKRVIGARMKQAGMCWSQPGAQAVLSLRAELLSGRWAEAWQATRPLQKVA